MNHIFWYRTVHYPKSSFIISLILWRQGTSLLSFSLRAMHILTIDGENVCKYAHVHVHVHVVVHLFMEVVKHNELWVNKIKAEEIIIEVLFLSDFVLYCSGSLKENRNFDTQFSLWDLCEIWGLVSRPWKKEAACLLQQWMRFWSNMLEMWYVLRGLGQQLTCSRADLILFLQLS